jgi:hypothetical protein
MNQPASTDGLGDPNTALHREADLIAARFPDRPRQEIDERLHDTYDRLSATATIRTHLVTVAGSDVTSDLLDDGAEFHSTAGPG